MAKPRFESFGGQIARAMGKEKAAEEVHKVEGKPIAVEQRHRALANKLDQAVLKLHKSESEGPAATERDRMISAFKEVLGDQKIKSWSEVAPYIEGIQEAANAHGNKDEIIDLATDSEVKQFIESRIAKGQESTLRLIMKSTVESGFTDFAEQENQIIALAANEGVEEETAKRIMNEVRNGSDFYEQMLVSVAQDISNTELRTKFLAMMYKKDVAEILAQMYDHNETWDAGIEPEVKRSIPFFIQRAMQGELDEIKELARRGDPKGLKLISSNKRSEMLDRLMTLAQGADPIWQTLGRSYTETVVAAAKRYTPKSDIPKALRPARDYFLGAV